jgi:hypothetical protein
MGELTDDFDAYDDGVRRPLREAMLQTTQSRNTMRVDKTLRATIEAQRVESEMRIRLDAYNDLGADVWVDGDVITFTKQFEAGGKEYLYAALKVDGNWYTTSTGQHAPLSWDNLKLFIVSGYVTRTPILTEQCIR